MIALVALRLAVGAHFYMEGVDKVRDPKPFSAGFLGIAKGPLAGLFGAMVWDADGLARLNYERGPDGKPRVNLDQTLDRWALYREKLIQHYGFDDAQKKQAEDVARSYDRQLRWFFQENLEEMEQYFLGLRRREGARQDRARQEVASLRGQVGMWTGEMYAKRAPWLRTVDAMWKGYEEDLQGIATPQQRQRSAPRLGKPGRKLLDSVMIDQIIPWFDITVGVLLLLGLATRVAALAGAGFLASIVATQWPGAPDAASTIYQTVELFSMLVLAAVGAGRFAGLDYILHGAWMRFRPKKKGTQHEPDA